MRFWARGEASLYGAIVVSILLVIFASLYSTAVINLSKQGEAYREALRSYLEASGERVGFTQISPGSIAAYSNTDSRIIYIVVANTSSVIYTRTLNLSLSPGDLVTILSGDPANMVLNGSAYLIAFTSRGNAFIYRGEPPGGSGSEIGAWASALLALARQQLDAIYTRCISSWYCSGTYSLSGDLLARSLVIGDGVTLYTADPAYQIYGVINFQQGSLSIVGARGGVGVTRIIVADTIVINGTLSSKGLGGAGNQLSCVNEYGYPANYCIGLGGAVAGVDLRNGGNVSSAGGGGYGRNSGIAGGDAWLLQSYVPGGTAGGSSYGYRGGDGGVNGGDALIRAILSSPNGLALLPLHGAGGGSGGPGSAPARQWGYGGQGGRGGGGIVIICNKLVMNNGVIEASGEDGMPGPLSGSGGGGGGGAGAIFIFCNSIEGSGVIRALGGGGGAGNGGGYPGGRGGDGWVVIVAGYISPGIKIEVGGGYKVTAIVSR